MGGPAKVTIKEPSSLPVGAVFVKPHAYRSQLFLLPTVLGALEPARKLLRAGHRPGYEFCTALRALHRSRILFDRLTSIRYKGFRLRNGLSEISEPTREFTHSMTEEGK
jgi:hypothetical protein